MADKVKEAKAGSVAACGDLVRATQAMAAAVAFNVLRDKALAEDAVQQAYLQAFRNLADLGEPAAFAGWLRRIVITVALNIRRTRRTTFLRLDDVPEIPVLDEAETHWSELQRQRLAAALLALSPAERQACDRRYHGGWSVARLAADAGVHEAVMRKRLQRIRDKLRAEIEQQEIDMVERHGFGSESLPPKLPERIVELLARPRLTDLPENPVGDALALLQDAYADFADVQLGEIVDLTQAAQTVVNDAIYVSRSELHRVDADRILRYDLTLPLLLAVRYEGRPLKLRASGKVYRACEPDATHLEAFHQAEIFWLDERAAIDPWVLTSRVLRSVDRVLPGRALKITPTQYPMCSQAWELAVEQDGEWSELLAWGIFTDQIVAHVGADPALHSAAGVGYGLERLAMLRCGIDDIRKIEVAAVA
ncbi:MAG TPA: sigma-70 family RNA polymerase sigma factor [Gammaproteobacteria bacterium]